MNYSIDALQRFHEIIGWIYFIKVLLWLICSIFFLNVGNVLKIGGYIRGAISKFEVANSKIMFFV